MDQQHLDEVLKTAVKVERVPGKLVATLKPPAKQRGRIVACGNFMTEVQGETSASGCIGMRAVLRKAADQGWEVSSLDVRRAFLSAPRLDRPGHVTLVDPQVYCRRWASRNPMRCGRSKGPYMGLVKAQDGSIHRDRPSFLAFGRLTAKTTYSRNLVRETLGNFRMRLIDPRWVIYVFMWMT